MYVQCKFKQSLEFELKRHCIILWFVHNTTNTSIVLTATACTAKYLHYPVTRMSFLAEFQHRANLATLLLGQVL